MLVSGGKRGRGWGRGEGGHMLFAVIVSDPKDG